MKNIKTNESANSITIRLLAFMTVLLGSSVYATELFYDGFEVPKLFCVQVGVTLIAAFFIWGLSRKAKLDIDLPLVFIPLFMLGLLSLLSVFWSRIPGLTIERSFHIGALASFALISFGLAAGKDIRPYSHVIIGICTLIVVWGLLLDFIEPLRNYIYPDFVQAYYGGKTHYRNLTSNQGNPNYTLHIIVMLLPVAIGAFIDRVVKGNLDKSQLKGWIVKALWKVTPYFLGVSVTASIISFIIAQNRSSLVASAVTIASFVELLFIFKRKTVFSFLRGRWKAILGITIISIVVLSAALISGRNTAPVQSVINNIDSRIDNWKVRFKNLANIDNIDVYSRVVFWETGLGMFADDPVLGKGTGQFQTHFFQYKTPKHWAYFNLLQPEIKKWSELPRQIHNEYLQILAELGAVGLILFLIFIFTLSRVSFRVLSAVRDKADFYLLAGMRAAITGCLFNAIFTFPLQTVTSSILFWSLTGLLLAAAYNIDREQDTAILKCVSISWKPGKNLLIALKILAIAIAVSGTLYSAKLVYSRMLFFESMKIHAKNLNRSRQLSEKVCRMTPYRFEVQYVDGWYALLAGDTASVRKSFEKTIELNPSFPVPYRYLPRLYYANGNYKRSVELIDQFKKYHSPGIDSEMKVILGLIALNDNNSDRIYEAERYIMESGNAEAVLHLIDMMGKRGRITEAVFLMGKVFNGQININIGNMSIEYYWVYANLLLSAGRTEDAITRLRAMVGRDKPEHLEGVRKNAWELLQKLENDNNSP